MMRGTETVGRHSISCLSHMVVKSQSLVVARQSGNGKIIRGTEPGYIMYVRTFKVYHTPKGLHIDVQLKFRKKI